MRAVVYHNAKDVRIEEVPEPGSLGPSEVLFKPRYCGICGTDLHEYVEGPKIISSKPHTLTGAKLPQIMGHEATGDVVEVGEQVTNVKAGDRVAIMPLIYCGKCYFCRRGLNHLCEIQGAFGLSYAWGGFAELAVAPDYEMVPLPDNVSYEQGALVEPAAVAAYAVERGGVQGGENVLIAGAGPIGALAALYAMAIGAGSVYVSETNPQRLKLAALWESRKSLTPFIWSRAERRRVKRERGYLTPLEAHSLMPYES